MKILCHIILWAGLATAGFSSGLVRAEAPPAPALSLSPGNSPEGKIQITADRMVSDTVARNAEFSGNVKAVYQTTVLTSERLKIYFTENWATARSQGADQAAAIERIVLQGNVRIQFDNQLAEADEAEYIGARQEIILSGEQARVSQGDNYITGKKIIVNRPQNRITVEAAPDAVVEAVFYSNEGGL